VTADQQLRTLLTAQRFGGHFMRKLADAGLAADPANRALIFETFQRLTDDYGPASCLYSEDLG
jgi:hypothetical protein